MVDYNALDNTLSDQLYKDLPDYDDYMFKRGFSAQEVYIAFHRSWNREIRQHLTEQKEAQSRPAPEVQNINIRGEVFLNGKHL